MDGSLVHEIRIPAARSGAKTGTRALQAQQFLRTLGQRVQARRLARGCTRKTLAEIAGVSERHLANLEHGVGNASIVVLLQVAQALACPLEDFFRPDPSGTAGKP